MRRFASLLLAGFALSWPCLGAGPGPSLLADGEFDTDTGNWAIVGAVSGNSFGPFGEDADGCLGSGSVELINGDTSGDLTFAEAVSECLPYNAVGSTLRLTVEARIMASTNGFDGSLAAIAFYTTADCTEPYASAPQTGTFSPPGDWYPLVKVATVPAGTQSLRVRLQVSKSLALQPSVIVLFDRVYLGSNAYVFNEGHELGEACRWNTVAP